MPILYTLADVDKLRDKPPKAGPLTKLANAVKAPGTSAVDMVRLMRFVQKMGAEVADYERQLAALAEACGAERTAGPSQVSMYSFSTEGRVKFDQGKQIMDADVREVLLSPLPASAWECAALSALDLIALEKFIVLPPDT